MKPLGGELGRITAIDVLEEPRPDLRLRRRQVLRQLRSTRYLHRLVQAQFDLAVATATMSTTELEDHLHRVGVARSRDAAQLITAGREPRAASNLSELVAVLRQFEMLENSLDAELETVTLAVVEQLRRNPLSALQPPALQPPGCHQDLILTLAP